MGTKNNTLLIVVIILIVGAIAYLQSISPKKTSLPAVSVVPTKDASLDKSQQFELAKEIVDPTGFINTVDGKPITIQSLIGKKVILLDIWTYSCINCQRTLPYLKSWYEKYKDQGLEIIGLHAPEFEFEKEYSNVQAGVKKFGITYPVVLDNNFGTARSYGMRYWPEEYLIDIDGYIVHKSIGEGGYEETEAKIVELLNERKKTLGENGRVEVQPTKVESSPVPVAQSPETYFGSARNQNLGNGVPGASGEKDFILPKNFSRNLLYLGGRWNIKSEYAESVGGNTEIVFKYKARNVYFVAHAAEASDITIFREGVEVGAQKGADVFGASQVKINESRLYKLIENDDGEEHTLKIVIPAGGVQAYTFTFG